MRVIHKREILPYFTDYELPADAKILTIAFQGNNNICLWYEAEQSPTPGELYVHPLVTRKFNVRPTGIPFREGFKEQHLATVVSPDGSLVFHIYEELP